MKKILTSIVTALTVFTFGMASVFAAGSMQGVVEITGSTDSTGADNAYTVTETTVPMLTAEIAASVIGNVQASELRVIWQRDISAETTPATLSFNVGGTDGQTVYVFHWNGSAWELVTSGAGPAVTATFSSLSPVGIVAKVPASTSTNNAATTSPTTSDNYVVLASLAVMVLAGSAAYVVASTKKA